MRPEKIKLVVLCLFVFASGTTQAISTAELCQLRGKILEAMAKERDKGVNKTALIDYTHKQFGKHGVKRSTINEYVAAVYSRRDVSPSVFYQLGELTCLQEFGN